MELRPGREMAPIACVMWYPQEKYILNRSLCGSFGVVKGKLSLCGRHKSIFITLLSSKAQPLKPITLPLITETSIYHLESHH